ncbi:hypothetical protein ONS96_009917 [Cadophora gregata f. sp. sojae]|nr:hypothetical protein ONS96_009917 [Cadophora gregata f. sp. sojae]
MLSSTTSRPIRVWQDALSVTRPWDGKGPLKIRSMQLAVRHRYFHGVSSQHLKLRPPQGRLLCYVRVFFNHKSLFSSTAIAHGKPPKKQKAKPASSTPATQVSKVIPPRTKPRDYVPTNVRLARLEKTVTMRQ